MCVLKAEFSERYQIPDKAKVHAHHKWHKITFLIAFRQLTELLTPSVVELVEVRLLNDMAR